MEVASALARGLEGALGTSIALSLGLAGVAWLFAFVMVGGRSAGRMSLPHRRARLWRGVGRMLALVGETPLVAWLLVREPWRDLAQTLSENLAGRGLALTGDQALGAVLVPALLCVLLAHDPAVALLVFLLLAAGVPTWHAVQERHRHEALSQEMPGVFRALAMALGSGETLSQAIGYVGSHVGGSAGHAFSRASLRLTCGETVEETVEALRRELPGPGMGLLATALVVSQRTGSPLGRLFEYAARLVERQGEFERLLMVKTAQVRLSVRIVSTLPVLIVAAMALLSPDFRGGLASPVGMACLVVAALLDGLALAIIRRQMGGILR